MKIVKNHYKVSKRVKRYSQIASDVEEMAVMCDNGVKNGLYDQAFALAHAQVSNDPFAFFVVNKNYIAKDGWPARAIINPEIISAPIEICIGKLADGTKDMRKNFLHVAEGCFSFPYRKPKKVSRYFRIKVRFQYRGFLGLLWTKRQWIEGAQAHVFQHELQHIKGGNIYKVK